MRIYRTAEIAAIMGVHPNTVRLYEEWGLISKPERMLMVNREVNNFDT